MAGKRKVVAKKKIKKNVSMRFARQSLAADLQQDAMISGFTHKLFFSFMLSVPGTALCSLFYNRMRPLKRGNFIFLGLFSFFSHFFANEGALACMKRPDGI